MIIQKEIRKMLEKKSGLDLNISANSTQLAKLISQNAQRPISGSTIRRLLGFYSDDREPLHYTLDTIARYLNCDNWQELQDIVNQGNSGFHDAADDFDSTTLSEGQFLRLSYRPDRRLKLACHGNNHYTVLSCEGSQNLHKGDELIIRSIVKGFPLLCQSVHRQGTLLGSYTAAETSGIEEIEIL